MTGWGVTLLLIGAIAVVAESHVPSLGIIGGPGVLALGAGAIMAVAGLGGSALLAVLTALVVVATASVVLALSVHKGVAVRQRKIRAGPERLIGHVGEVRSWSESSGTVQVDGALWRARLGWSDEEPMAEMHAGDRVVVDGLQGLTIKVRRAEQWELMP